MNDEILIGDKGRTVSPLKPTGKVRINGQILDANSGGSWVDMEVEVVVVGGHLHDVSVREVNDDLGAIAHLGRPLMSRKIKETPLHAPRLAVERLPAVPIGLVMGIVLITSAYANGIPLTLDAICVPIAGAIAGYIFQLFVRGPFAAVGPREEHRHFVRIAAFSVPAGVVAGVVAGFWYEVGFATFGIGIVVAAIAGGVLGFVL